MSDPIGAAAEEAAKVVAAGVVSGLLLWIGIKRQKVRDWFTARRLRRAATAKLAAQVDAFLSRLDELHDALGSLKASVAAIEVLVRSQSDLATEGVFECNAQGEFTFVNRTFHLMVGVGRNDLMGKKWKHYLHPEDAAAFERQLSTSLSEHRMLSAKVRLVRPDNDVLKFDITMLPYPDMPPASNWFGKARLVV